MIPDRFVIELPFRILLANQYNSMYPMKRGWYSRQLWVYLSNGIPHLQRPKTPWARWSILIERESTQRPDPGAIWAGSKPIPDILQPHSSRHPLGLGIVAQDNDTSLIQHECLHVQGPRKWSRITIVNEGVQ